MAAHTPSTENNLGHSIQTQLSKSVVSRPKGQEVTFEPSRRSGATVCKRRFTYTLRCLASRFAVRSDSIRHRFAAISWAAGCNKWGLKGCLAALPGNRPKSAFFALFLPFPPLFQRVRRAPDKSRKRRNWRGKSLGHSDLDRFT